MCFGHAFGRSTYVNNDFLRGNSPHTYKYIHTGTHKHTYTDTHIDLSPWINFVRPNDRFLLFPERIKPRPDSQSVRWPANKAARSNRARFLSKVALQLTLQTIIVRSEDSSSNRERWTTRGERPRNISNIFHCLKQNKNGKTK